MRKQYFNSFVNKAYYEDKYSSSIVDINQGIALNDLSPLKLDNVKLDNVEEQFIPLPNNILVEGSPVKPRFTQTREIGVKVSFGR